MSILNPNVQTNSCPIYSCGAVISPSGSPSNITPACGCNNDPNVQVKTIDVNNINSRLGQGDMSALDDLTKAGVKYTKTQVDNTTTITYTYKNKNYTVKYVDNTKVDTKEFEEYRTLLVLVNFMGDVNRKSDNINDYYKIDGITLTKDNYKQYIDKIKSKVTNANKLKDSALEKLVKDFQNGDLNVDNLHNLLNAIGGKIKNGTFNSTTGMFNFTIEYKGKTYDLACRADYAQSGTDDLRISSENQEVPQTPDVPDEPEVPQTPDVPDEPEVPSEPDVPSEPEVPAKTQGRNSGLVSGVVRGEVPADLKDFTYYNKLLVLINFMSNANRVSDNIEEYYKTADGEKLTKENYAVYAKSIEDVANSIENIQQKAFVKFVNDFSSGNFVNNPNNINLVLNALGGKLESFMGNYYGTCYVGLTYNGDSYNLSCQADYAQSGTDDLRISSENQEVPQTPDVPDEPEVPQTPDVPDEPEVPPTPDVPNEPDVPSEPEVPPTPDVPNEPEVPSEPEVPQTPDVPSEPEVPPTPNAPDEPEVPAMSQGRTSGLVSGVVRGEVPVDLKDFTYYQKLLVLLNLLDDVNTLSDDVGEFIKTATGEKLTMDNYADFAKSIEDVAGSIEDLIEKAFKKFAIDFTCGNFCASNIPCVIGAMGGSIGGASVSNGIISFSVTVNNHKYNLKCSAEAAGSGTDDIRDRSADEFDKDGYDKDGFDIFGRDRDGYDKDGYDIDGYGRDGYDRQGLDRDGFDRNGCKTVWNGNTLEIYENRLLVLKEEYHVYKQYNSKTKSYDTIRELSGQTRYNYDSNGVLLSEDNYDIENDRIKDTIEYRDGKPYRHIHINYKKDGTVHNKQITYYDENGEEYYASKLLTKAEKNAASNIHNVLYYGVGMAASCSSYGEIGLEFLHAAGVGTFNSTYVGTYSTIGYNDSTYSKYKDFLDAKIQKEVTEEYCYNADEIKGYYFDINSKLSKRIAGNKDFKTFVKNNLDKLLAGYKATGLDDAMGFNFKSANDEQLYHALSGVNVIESWQDEKGKLHLIIADTYDFTGEGHGTGHGDLCAAGDAAMKDGQLKPYYTLIEVVIDPKTL